MELDNILKGQLTQSLIKTILEKAGYRVSRLGVEEVFKEVIHLELEQYLNLNLPKQLRSLPDLLVATPEVDKAWLVEVKFRKDFTWDTRKELHETLSKQFKYWENAVAILLIGEYPSKNKPGKFIQDNIRVITPDNFDILTTSYDLEEVLRKMPPYYDDTDVWDWDKFNNLQHFFERIDPKKHLKSVDYMIHTLNSLVK